MGCSDVDRKAIEKRFAEKLSFDNLFGYYLISLAGCYEKETSH